MQITDLLAFGVKNKASDLHLSAGMSPMIRVHGDIRRINLPEMSAEEVDNSPNSSAIWKSGCWATTAPISLMNRCNCKGNGRPMC